MDRRMEFIEIQNSIWNIPFIGHKTKEDNKIKKTILKSNLRKRYLNLCNMRADIMLVYM